LRFDQPDFPAGDLDAAQLCIEAFFDTEIGTVFFCERIDKPEPGIVQGPLVPILGIAESGDDGQVTTHWLNTRLSAGNAFLRDKKAA
jgi:hypothetical protein